MHWLSVRPCIVKSSRVATQKKDLNLVFKTDYRLMQVKSIAEGEHSAILLTFIKLPSVIKIVVLSIFEWLLKTNFTVNAQAFMRYCLLWVTRSSDKQKHFFLNYNQTPLDMYNDLSQV